MVEGAALEMLYRGTSIEGSNPSLSASPVLRDRIFFVDVQFVLARNNVRLDVLALTVDLIHSDPVQPNRPDT